MCKFKYEVERISDVYWNNEGMSISAKEKCDCEQIETICFHLLCIF